MKKNRRTSDRSMRVSPKGDDQLFNRGRQLKMTPAGSRAFVTRPAGFGGRSGRFRGATLKSKQSKVLLGVSGPVLRRRDQE